MMRARMLPLACVLVLSSCMAPLAVPDPSVETEFRNGIAYHTITFASTGGATVRLLVTTPTDQLIQRVPTEPPKRETETLTTVRALLAEPHDTFTGERFLYQSAGGLYGVVELWPMETFLRAMSQTIITEGGETHRQAIDPNAIAVHDLLFGKVVTYNNPNSADTSFSPSTSHIYSTHCFYMLREVKSVLFFRGLGTANRNTCQDLLRMKALSIESRSV